MDPQAALDGARMAADELAQLLDVDEPDETRTRSIEHAADNLLTNFRSLDSWLSQGGFFPPDWAGMRRDPQDPEEVLDHLEGGA